MVRFFFFQEFALYGMSPFYDQPILVHCHICNFITKISQLADHLCMSFFNNHFAYFIYFKLNIL